jgi:hypothetical protein
MTVVSPIGLAIIGLFDDGRSTAALRALPFYFSAADGPITTARTCVAWRGVDAVAVAPESTSNISPKSQLIFLVIRIAGRCNRINRFTHGPSIVQGLCNINLTFGGVILDTTPRRFIL